MQSVDFTNPIVLEPIVLLIVMVLFFIIYAARYRKYSLNEYVIWLRNGEVRKAGIGGSGWLYPLIDQTIIIPATMQLTKLDVELYDYQQAQKTLILGIELNWRIMQPELFYKRLYSMTEKKIKNEELELLYKSYVRDSLASKTIDDMYGKSRGMLNELKNDLNERLKDFGIGIESLEIETVTNL